MTPTYVRFTMDVRMGIAITTFTFHDAEGAMVNEPVVLQQGEERVVHGYRLVSARVVHASVAEEA